MRTEKKNKKKKKNSGTWERKRGSSCAAMPENEADLPLGEITWFRIGETVEAKTLDHNEAKWSIRNSVREDRKVSEGTLKRLPDQRFDREQKILKAGHVIQKKSFG